ncbi:hypothetical protein EBU02_10125 [bacterium]|nr:hypothetical protein [bacterium]
MRALVKFLGVTLLALLVAAYIGVGLSRISFNVDILRLLPTHLKQVEGLSLFLKNFALPDELIVTIDAAEPEQAKAAADAIAIALQGRPDLVKLSFSTSLRKKYAKSRSSLRPIRPPTPSKKP